MEHSEQINELAAALCKAQGQLKGALKDSSNPFFKTHYADLTSTWDACREALQANGLAVIQSPLSTTDGIGVETMLVHSSGQWIRGSFVLPLAKADPQGGGSCITYARRYALAAFVGVCPEDDDGNAAAASIGKAKAIALEKFRKAAAQGSDALKLAWQGAANHEREACKGELENLKAQAAKVQHA